MGESTNYDQWHRVNYIIRPSSRRQKKLLKKEFPRSRKVRLYDLGSWDEDKDFPLKLKTL
jgi:hypothetical protein